MPQAKTGKLFTCRCVRDWIESSHSISGSSESKYDSKSNLYLLNELAELNNCNNCLFFEVRRATDLFLWVSKTPNGPSAKFHVQNGRSFIWCRTKSE